MIGCRRSPAGRNGHRFPGPPAGPRQTHRPLAAARLWPSGRKEILQRAKPAPEPRCARFPVLDSLIAASREAARSARTLPRHAQRLTASLQLGAAHVTDRRRTLLPMRYQGSPGADVKLSDKIRRLSSIMLSLTAAFGLRAAMTRTHFSAVAGSPLAENWLGGRGLRYCVFLIFEVLKSNGTKRRPLSQEGPSGRDEYMPLSGALWTIRN